MNKRPDPNFILFDLKGVRYAIVCPDPNNPPFLPQGAKEVHLCVSPDREYGYERASPDEARAAFREGFIGAGGDPKKLDEYFRAASTSTPAPDDELPF